METQIKVHETKMHKISRDCKYCNSTGKYEIRFDNIIDCQHCKNKPLEVPVAEAKLILIQCTKEEGLLFRYKDSSVFYFSTTVAGQVNKPDVVSFKPIFISETEKIEANDWMYYSGNNTIERCTNSSIDWKNEYGWNKIVSLPEHFSDKHLRAIVDDKMKDGDKVLVECNKKYDYLLVSSGDKPYYEIKLNSSNHITLHKLVEKMIPLSLAKKAFWAGYDTAINKQNQNAKFKEWFEQNIN